MGLKIFRVVWFLSVIFLLFTMLYAYAGWKEELVIREDADATVTIGREPLFYLLMGSFAVINALVYLVGKLVPAEDFRAWFHGLIITINIFSVIAMNLIGLYNSSENYDYSRMGIVVYGSIGLVIIWSAAWPFYRLYQKFFIKETV